MSQTPPPSGDEQRGAFRNLLIRLIRGTIARLEGWVVRLEREEPAEERSPLQNPWLWLGGVAIALVIAVTAPSLLSTLQSSPDIERRPETDIAERPAPEVPREPLPEMIEEPDNAASEVTKEPEPLPEMTDEPKLSPEVPPEIATEPIEEPPPTAEPETEEPELPTDLRAPQVPAPLELAEPKLTPEQRLVAAVRSQIAGVARPYQSDPFVTGLSANFDADVLRVQLTAQWYDLEDADRSQLANELWHKARSLDFSHVEILDPRGVLVARNPVIGDRAVVLRQSLPSRVFEPTP